MQPNPYSSIQMPLGSPRLARLKGLLKWDIWNKWIMAQLHLKSLHLRCLSLLFSLSLDRTRSFSRSVLHFYCILHTIYIVCHQYTIYYIQYTFCHHCFQSSGRFFTEMIPFFHSWLIIIKQPHFLDLLRSSSVDETPVNKFNTCGTPHISPYFYMNAKKSKGTSVVHFSISFNIISLKVCWRQRGCLGSPGTSMFPSCHLETAPLVDLIHVSSVEKTAQWLWNDCTNCSCSYLVWMFIAHSQSKLWEEYFISGEGPCRSCAYRADCW